MNMEIQKILDYCAAKKGVTETFPFDDVTLVFKVGGKMFLLVPLESNRRLFQLEPIQNGAPTFAKNFRKFLAPII